MIYIQLNLRDSNAVKQALAQAQKVLEAGGLVIYPTETVYGIGADAQSAPAIDKLLAYKGRREGKPLSIAVDSKQMADQYVLINQQAREFYNHFLPGPYTVISKSKNMVDQRVESEFGTLGIRIPDYPLILDLVRNFGRAITSTSANASGEKRPYSVTDILDRLSDKQKSLIDLIIDVGTLPKNEPSVVIDTTLSTPIALRGQMQHQSAGKQQIVLSISEAETMGLAGRLLLNHWTQVIDQGLVIALNGELGMGKTVFTKGVAKFLQIKEVVSSPTYSYMNEYNFSRGQTSGVLYHVDAWKIDHPDEVALLQLGELLRPNNIIVIEWFDQISQWLKLPSKTKVLRLDFVQDLNGRSINVSHNSIS
jgi:L-threonylcarbamoyladenylate synthase